jgi:ABC-type polysaccharide/polyol phosphate transport system ATPase subunit
VSAAIAVDGLSKTFAVPHEWRGTLREHLVHPRRRTTYEVNAALRDVTFSVEQGEFFGIVGPNGSGKSTLLKIVAGIYRADSGTVQVAGRVSPIIELGVGFAPDLNARDNVLISGTLLGLSRREIARRFDEIVRFAELERFVDQKVGRYSSGMRQRLAFSLAIQVPFEVLLLDEIFAVGDQSFKAKCYSVFERMKEEGKTVVLVSHQPEAVTRFCDRALFLRDGTVQALGPASEIASAYRGPAEPGELIAASRSPS